MGFEFLGVLVFIFVVLLLGSLKQINQYERGILFNRGKYSKVLTPGWHVVWPIFQSMKSQELPVYGSPSIHHHARLCFAAYPPFYTPKITPRPFSQ